MALPHDEQKVAAESIRAPQKWQNIDRSYYAIDTPPVARLFRSLGNRRTKLPFSEIAAWVLRAINHLAMARRLHSGYGVRLRGFFALVRCLL